MSPLLRAASWSSAYLVLALLPLAAALVADPIGGRRTFALELSVALGFVAFAVLAIEVALVSRLRAASAPFGTDALMLFHRKMGIAAAVLAIAHPLLLGRAGSSLWNPFAGTTASRFGAVASWSALALVASAVLRKRWKLRYEAWKRWHQVLAVAAIAFAWLHAREAGRYAGAPLVAGVLGAYALAFVALMLRYDVVRPLLLSREPWEVVENRDEGADTRTLVVRPVAHGGMRFAPGQFVWLLTGRHPLVSEQHPISVSSSAEPAKDGRIELSIKALGDWSSSVVPAIERGARVWLDGPFGAFSIDGVAEKGLVLIAGGIGITPMRSMLLTLRDRGDERPVVLVYAASHPRRALFRSELAELERELDLRVVYVFERPDPDGKGERGFVTAELLRRNVPGDPRDRHFFVCGPPPMMDGLESVLAELGVPAAQVSTERFDMV
jgi:predicted ferric reductase